MARGRRAQAVREMTMMSTKAARDKAFPAELELGSHWQASHSLSAAWRSSHAGGQRGLLLLSAVIMRKAGWPTDVLTE